MNEGKKRELWVDIARGLAMILIMLSHMIKGPTLIDNCLYSAYIPIFFFISGYVHKSNKPIFTSKRCAALLIPYFCYNTICIVVKFILDLMRHGGGLKGVFLDFIGVFYSRFSLFQNMNASGNTLFFSASNSPLWFLTAMITASVFFQLYLSAKPTHIKKGLCVCYIILTLFMNRISILLPWSIDCAPFFAIFMILGHEYRGHCKHCFANKDHKPNDKYIPIVFALSVVTGIIYCMLVYVNGTVNLSIRNYGLLGNVSVVLCFIISCLGIIVFIVTSKYLAKNRFSKCLEMIGKNTITILGTHLLILNVVEILFGALGIRSKWLYVLVSFTSSFLCVWIIRKVINLIVAKYPNCKYLLTKL